LTKKNIHARGSGLLYYRLRNGRHRKEGIWGPQKRKREPRRVDAVEKRAKHKKNPSSPLEREWVGEERNIGRAANIFTKRGGDEDAVGG